MAVNLLKLRRTAKDLGATDGQADEFAESFNDVTTRSDLKALRDELYQAIRDSEHRIVNRVILATMAVGGLIIGAVALLT